MFLFGGLYFLIGIVAASFALCFVMRKDQGLREFAMGRSTCEYCRQELSRFELIPVFSWLIQGGRCRNCNHSLGHIYPLSELSGGIVFMLMGFLTMDLPISIQLCCIVILMGLLILALYDIWYKELHIVVYLLVLLSIVFLYTLLTQFAFLYSPWGFIAAASGIWSAGRIGVRLLGLLLARIKTGVRTEGFGLGDVLLAAALGSLLPFVFMYIGVDYGSELQLYNRSAFILSTFVVHMAISSTLGVLVHSIRQRNSVYLPFLPYMILGFALTVLLVFYHSYLFIF